ncbi:SCP2 sterol-binding domain-containing protein [Actinospongicola halichondriae]|uniref:SCP2 sterol-binding domain-containing protein n=1 Tax=Actinospongicola halichondriae TaxID=3236844 RepID=UPI003D4881B2
MTAVKFLSSDWIDALDAAARRRQAPDDDPLATVQLSIDQVVVDGPTWRLSVDCGSLRVESSPDGEPDVRLTSDRETAASIASGQRPALDAFIAGDLRLGGDVRVLLEHRAALETLGDLFAGIRPETEFD